MVHTEPASPRERMVNRRVDSSSSNFMIGISPSSMTSGATKRTSSTATRADSVRSTAALRAASRYAAPGRMRDPATT